MYICNKAIFAYVAYIHICLSKDEMVHSKLLAGILPGRKEVEIAGGCSTQKCNMMTFCFLISCVYCFSLSQQKCICVFPMW